MTLTPGLKFRWRKMPTKFEVKEVRESANEIDLILESSEGWKWVEVCHLDNVKAQFANKTFYVPELTPELNIGII